MGLHLKSKKWAQVSIILLSSASVTIAATAPYDLIRPTWPLSFDSTALGKFDTTITQKIGVLPTKKTPTSYKAGELILDTLDQAYLDVLNTKISPIRVNQAGYLKKDTDRQFYYVGTAKEFEVVDAYGKSLSPKVTGIFSSSGVNTTSDWTIIAGTDCRTNDQKRYKVNITGTEGEILLGLIPQSVPTEKRLRIKVGDDISSTFIVSEDVYTMVKDATIKFFGIQRSGNSESWFHGSSHAKDGSGSVVNLNGSVSSALSIKAGDLQGGWYDAGDHLKESQTQAFAFMSLAVMSATNPTKDVDHYAYNHRDFVKTDGVPDMLREAKHGADFFLRSYRAAKGVIDNMPVSVGNFGSDHGSWNRPEFQDYVSTKGRGGPEERDVRLGELGSNISGEIAAGLAILSKDYAEFDKDFADSCLTVAEKMYDFAKSLAQGKKTYDGDKPFVYNTEAAGWMSPAYGGNNEYADDLALASVALLYATSKEEYLNDALRAKDLDANQVFADGAGFFTGGWFVTENKAFLKNDKNTSWANSHTYALYALYKLILSDPQKAISYGLTEEERLTAIEDVVANMIYNVSDMSNFGSASIILPAGSVDWKQNTVTYDPIWFTMYTDQAWLYNHFQAGNIFEVLAYADVAYDLEKQAIKLSSITSSDWKASEMFQLGINQLNYMLGVNPWDFSFIYGVGDKNDNHPHHRAANPEGKNSSFLEYNYVAPVGALFGGQKPDNVNSIVPVSLSWQDYHLSETTLGGSSLLISALTIASNGGSEYYDKKCDNCNTEDPTPLAENEVYAAAYQYQFSEVDYISMSIQNASLKKIDSVVAYLYFEASEEDVSECGAIFDYDICQTYDLSGFNKPCSNNIINLNNLTPEKVDDSYNDENKTFTWALPIFLDTLSIGSQTRLDIGVSSGIKSDNTCESRRKPAKIDISKSWSLRSHSTTNKEPVDYAGAPLWDKNAGDFQKVPANPYIVIRSKNELLWGHGPYNTTIDHIIVKIPIASKALIQINNRSLFVQAPAQGNKTLKIFDLLGNLLLSQAFVGPSTEISLIDLPHRGTLVAKLMTNGKTLATKAFKNK